MVEQENLLVIDFGGRTLDLSLVRLDGGVKAGKAAGVYSQMGRSYWLKTRRRK